MLRLQLDREIRMEQKSMFDEFEKMLTTKEDLDKLVSDQVDDVYNRVNDRVKKHIDFRRKDSLTKKR